MSESTPKERSCNLQMGVIVRWSTELRVYREQGGTKLAFDHNIYLGQQ
jgi:hypothetical protein